MRVIYHNRNRLSPALEDGACYVSFDQLLAQSDVLSLNLSLNATTRHIISHREFAKMKDGAVIVNTARGALIDEKALVSALKSGKVRKPQDQKESKKKKKNRGRVRREDCDAASLKISNEPKKNRPLLLTERATGEFGWARRIRERAVHRTRAAG